MKKTSMWRTVAVAVVVTIIMLVGATAALAEASALWGS
jgi:hypothetical protein